nr:unnamed protein product [Callosobruchus analis]
MYKHHAMQRKNLPVWMCNGRKKVSKRFK